MSAVQQVKVRTRRYKRHIFELRVRRHNIPKTPKEKRHNYRINGGLMDGQS